jgi:predicted nucleic acid-binding protein
VTRFFDASALVKRYVAEQSSGKVLALLRSGVRVISRLSLVEVASALRRRCRAGDLSPDECERLVTAMICDAERFVVVEMSPAVVRSAVELLQRHPLRSGDVVQLASACTLSARSGEQVAFVAFDDRLRAAARAEGLAVRP